jgi:hypothetical protein
MRRERLRTRSARRVAGQRKPRTPLGRLGPVTLTLAHNPGQRPGATASRLPANSDVFPSPSVAVGEMRVPGATGCSVAVNIPPGFGLTVPINTTPSPWPDGPCPALVLHWQRTHTVAIPPRAHASQWRYHKAPVAVLGWEKHDRSSRDGSADCGYSC